MHDPLDDLIDASAQALGLPLDPAWKPDVKANLKITLERAAFVGGLPLPEEAEPAPIFVA